MRSSRSSSIFFSKARILASHDSGVPVETFDTEGGSDDELCLGVASPTSRDTREPKALFSARNNPPGPLRSSSNSSPVSLEAWERDPEVTLESATDRSFLQKLEEDSGLTFRRVVIVDEVRIPFGPVDRSVPRQTFLAGRVSAVASAGVNLFFFPVRSFFL
jgi:hypothetical protein